MPIDYEKRDGVAYITLNNPGKANILDKPTSDAISDAWVDMWEDRAIRCAILTGKGDTRVSAHATDLLAAGRNRARPEDGRRRSHGGPLSARMETGHCRR